MSDGLIHRLTDDALREIAVRAERQIALDAQTLKCRLTEELMRQESEDSGGTYHTKGCGRLSQFDASSIALIADEYDFYGLDRNMLLGLDRTKWKNDLLDDYAQFDHRTEIGRAGIYAFFKMYRALIDVTWFSYAIQEGSLRDRQSLFTLWTMLDWSKDVLPFEKPPSGSDYLFNSITPDGWIEFMYTSMWESLVRYDQRQSEQIERFRLELKAEIQEEYRDTKKTGHAYEVYLGTIWWVNTRAKILNIAGYQCEHQSLVGPYTIRCSCKERLQVHHLTYERVTEERDSDLIVLCDKHHADIHNKPRRGWRDQ